MKTVVTILNSETLEWSGRRYARNPDGEALLAAAIAEAGFDGMILRRRFLTPEQDCVTRLAHANGGRLTRYPGGFWTTADAWERRDSLGFPEGGRSGGTQTIRALIRKGVLVEDGMDAHGRQTVRISDAAYG